DAGLPTAPAVAIEPTSFEENKKTLLDDIESKVGLPCVVKPACDGSSFGVSLPAHRVGLEAAIETMTRAGRVVLAEKRISGTELTCAVLEYGHGPRPMPVTEIAPADKYAFFDYEAKYTPGASQEITPARIPDALRDELQRLAVAAHKALGCRDMSRTDFIADDERPWLLETNTIPGLTGNSLLPQAAAAAGLSFPQLIQHLVACARRRA
ncbi:MAG: D-alanine--D-alanine ligase, partial [Myxococcota bacterium]